MDRLQEMKRWARVMMAEHPRNQEYYAGILVGILNTERWAGGNEEAINAEIAALSQTRNFLPLVETLMEIEASVDRTRNPGRDVSDHLRGAVLCTVNYDLYMDGAKQWPSFDAFAAAKASEEYIMEGDDA